MTISNSIKDFISSLTKSHPEPTQEDLITILRFGLNYILSNMKYKYSHTNMIFIVFPNYSIYGVFILAQTNKTARLIFAYNTDKERAICEFERIDLEALDLWSDLQNMDYHKRLALAYGIINDK
jgi:hypothetical protein